MHRRKNGPWWSGFVLLMALVFIACGIGVYQGVIKRSADDSAVISSEKIQTLPIVSLVEFLAFVDSSDRIFSYREYGEEIVVAHEMPGGGLKLYRLDYSAKTQFQVTQVLAGKMSDQ